MGIHRDDHNDSIQIYIPETPTQFDIADTAKVDRVSFLDQLENSQLKNLGYFNEILSVFIVVKSEREINLKVSVSYQETMDKALPVGQPIFASNNLKVWKLNVTIIPERYSKFMKIKAHYKKIDELEDDGTMEDYEVPKSIVIADTTLITVNQQITIVSEELSIEIAPVFQMMFRRLRSEKTLTSLELTPSKLLREMKKSIKIKSVDIQIANCDLADYTNLSYPVVLKPTAQLSLAYRLINNDNKTVKPTLVTVNSTIDDKEISTKWATSIDFQVLTSAPLPTTTNSSLSLNGAPISPNFNFSQPKVRSTSSMLSIPKRFTSSTRIKSASSASMHHLPTQKKGLLVSVSGQTTVKMGEVFKWKLQLINKSSEHMSLILYIQSSIKKQYEKSVPPIPIQNSSSFNVANNDVVPIFTSTQLIKSFYGKFSKAGLISLTNNLRMDLEPGNLFESELELIGIEKGLFNLHDFKVFDTITGETFECPKLLDVLVV